MDHSYFKSIADALKSVQKPHFYATGGMYPMSLPSLTINGAPDDLLGLPLSKDQAKVIIESSAQAPFGRADTSVHHTWRLSPSQFSINNADEWSGQLQALVNKVKDELRCDPKMTVMGELCSLLLCEAGGSFKVSFFYVR